jgi:hypothetical protein
MVPTTVQKMKCVGLKEREGSSLLSAMVRGVFSDECSCHSPQFVRPFGTPFRIVTGPRERSHTGAGGSQKTKSQSQ